MLKFRSDVEIVPVLDGYRVAATYLFSADEVNRLEPEGLVRMRLVTTSDADLEFWFVGRDVKKLLLEELGERKSVAIYLSYRTFSTDGSVKGYLVASLRQLKHLSSLAELKVKSIASVKLDHPPIPEPDGFELYMERTDLAAPTLDEMATLTPLYIKSLQRLPVESEVTEMYHRMQYLKEVAAEKGEAEPTTDELVEKWLQQTR
jgi:hypothetical protein